MTEAEIDHVIETLKKVATDQSGWLTLYRNPATGQFWEMSYPNGGMHGGGPRQLAEVSLADAKARYPDC
jgi:hypothetical protein